MVEEPEKKASKEVKMVELPEEPDIKYLAVRYIEMICIGIFVFGALWEGTIVMNLTTPQFLMVYGGCGALISECLARLFKKKGDIKK